MTLEQAVAAARLQVVQENGHISVPNLNNQVLADRHNAAMQELFAKMCDAEVEVRANWKSPAPKKKEIE
jgi:hypothetical protein